MPDTSAPTPATVPDGLRTRRGSRDVPDWVRPVAIFLFGVLVGIMGLILADPNVALAKVALAPRTDR